MIFKANKGRSGSVQSLNDYLEKEQEMVMDKDLHQPFIDQDNNELTKDEATQLIDDNHGRLGGGEAHYYHLTLNPSDKEMAHLGNDSKKLREFTHQAMDEYAKNFNKDNIKSHTDLVYTFKIENFRWDKKDGNGNELKKWGKDEQGNRVINWKKVDGMHVHITASHNSKVFKKFSKAKGKEVYSWTKLSPKNNNKSTIKSSNKIQNSGFHQVALSHKMENKFDDHTNYKRPYEESLDYYKTMKTGVKHVDGSQVPEKGKPQKEVRKDAKINALISQREINKNKSLTKTKAPTKLKSKPKVNVKGMGSGFKQALDEIAKPINNPDEHKFDQQSDDETTNKGMGM